MNKLYELLRRILFTRTGIKVCRKDVDGSYISAFSDGRNVEYKIGKWSKRPDNCGSLAVFDTLDNAEEFIRYRSYSKVFFECKYIKSRTKLLYKPSKYIPDEIFKKYNVPKGTKFADKVLLTKILL